MASSWPDRLKSCWARGLAAWLAPTRKLGRAFWKWRASPSRGSCGSRGVWFSKSGERQRESRTRVKPDERAVEAPCGSGETDLQSIPHVRLGLASDAATHDDRKRKHKHRTTGRLRAQRTDCRCARI